MEQIFEEYGISLLLFLAGGEVIFALAKSLEMIMEAL